MTTQTIHNSLGSTPKTSFARMGVRRVSFMPAKISNAAMLTYILALMACSLLYSKYVLDWKWWIFGLISVLGFFYFANRQTKLWINTRPMAFTKKLFWTALALRVVWVIISYLLYYKWTDTAFSIGAGDELFYDEVARYGANMIREGNWRIHSGIMDYANPAFSDMGIRCT